LLNDQLVKKYLQVDFMLAMLSEFVIMNKCRI